MCPSLVAHHGMPCFESSSPEHWPYHNSHGYPYPYPPCCGNNNFHYFPGFQHPHFFTPQPMTCYGDHYPHSYMCNFYPPHQPKDDTREFDNYAEKPRSCYLNGHPVNPKQHMSYPYPFMWVPPEFMKSKELEKPHADIVKADKVSNGADHQPNAWDGCFPIDMNTLSSLLESEKGKDGQSKEEKKDFLFPKFWMPSYHEQTANPKGEKKISSDDVPYTIKFIPLNKAGMDRNESHLKSEEIQNGSGINKNTECPGGKGRVGSTCPHKISKSVPLCLRVDPLPTKRSQTRSSSPASGRRKSCGTLEKLTGDANSKMELDGEKIVQVVDAKKSECRLADENHHSVSNIQMINNTKEGQRMVNEETKCQGVAETLIQDPIVKKIWSDVKAAELIQSVYRGYTVRKWDSLKKLKQLSEVKKEVENVRNRVEHLQSDHPGDEKDKTMISELIMRLLLKLDTIQGLLPFVRQVRKSLAKELVILQGVVDEISMVPSGQSTEENVPTDEVKSSGEVMEELIMETVVDEGKHLVLDCPSKTLESDDVKSTSDEAASDFESINDIEEACVMPNGTMADGQSKLEERVASGENTIAVDVVNFGQTVPLEDCSLDSSPTNIVKHDSTEARVILNPRPGEGVLMMSKTEEEEVATMEEHFSMKLTPITGDALYNKEEQELEVGVIESSTLVSINLTDVEADPALKQNHPEEDLIQLCNVSAYDINDNPMNGNEADDIEASESVKSLTVQLADVYEEVITSEDQQLENSRAETVEEERNMGLHAEFQVEEDNAASEPKAESECTEEERGGEEEEIGGGRKVRENELREMLEKLMEVGKEQVNLISNLSCRVKQLEKELKQKKMKKKMPRAKLLPKRVSLSCN